MEAFKRDREFRHAEIKRQREEEARKLEEEAIRTEMQLRAKEKERLVSAFRSVTKWLMRNRGAFREQKRILMSTSLLFMCKSHLAFFSEAHRKRKLWSA